MLKIFEKIQTMYQACKDERFLKKHHCVTWEQYHRNYDPDVWRACSRIKEFYHGYPYVHCVERGNHFAYELLYDYGPGGLKYGYNDILDWCKENCKNKYRADVHRVMWHQWMKEWETNEIGGSDYIFFAFKDKHDYVNFLLRWA